MERTLYFKDDDESQKYFENERKMKENSQKWYETDDPEEKAKLHFQNQVLSGEQDLIDGGNRTFDENSGAWSVDYGNSVQNSSQWKNEKDNKFVSQRNEQIDALYDEIVNQKNFLYSPDTDPSYKAYEDMYRREGDRASKSTLADIATAQGGISSYAASAAQQASNAYAQALTDKIPELEALAYQKYSADRNDKYNQLDYLMALDDIDYGRFIDDRNYNYQLGRDKVLDDRYNNEWNYGVSRDAVNDERYILERADRNYINDINVASQVKSDLIELISKGYEPTEGDLKWAGLTPEDVERIKYVNMFGMYPERTSKKTADDDDDEDEDEEDEEEEDEEEEEGEEIYDEVDKIVKAYESGTMTRGEAESRLGSLEMSEWLKSR